jgi:hypothetical protein
MQIIGASGKSYEPGGPSDGEHGCEWHVSPVGQPADGLKPVRTREGAKADEEGKTGTDRL